jgi:stress response protein YsnF
MRQTVIGFFNSSSEAESAGEKLRSAGFTESDIDVSVNHTQSYGGTDYSEGQRRGSTDTPYSVSDESRYDSSGASDGSAYDSTTSSRNSLDEDRLRDRRGDNDGIGDSIGRFFRNLFDNKEEAERYTSIGRRNAIVSVYAESATQAERARDILDECGAVDVDEQSAEYSSSENTMGVTQTASASQNIDDTERTQDYDSERRNMLGADGVTDQSIPVIEENINIGKREEERGGVRLRSRIVERPVEENLRLREERVNVERVPVDRPASDSDFETFREGEVEMSETAEVPIVNKEARVVEEVRLKKDVEERDEVVRDTVRKTDVEVEKLNEETTRSGRGRKRI